MPQLTQKIVQAWTGRRRLLLDGLGNGHLFETEFLDRVTFRRRRVVGIRRRRIGAISGFVFVYRQRLPIVQIPQVVVQRRCLLRFRRRRRRRRDR